MPNPKPSILAVLLLVLPLLHGCAASPAFAAGAKQYLPDVAGELRTYVNADTAFDVATKADHLAVADKLDAAVNAKPVTLDAVSDAWQTARPVYTRYIDADVKLTPIEKSRRAYNVARFDELIGVERKRWIYPATPAPSP